MPANLPPTYHEAEERYRSARDPAEKITALEEMLRIMPKHKGTEKLQADLKARMSKLRKQPQKKGASRAASHIIPHEGAGQIALIGAPNTGKSSLVARLTHATPEVAEYPFTTRLPVPGMMPFEDVAFQLIDLPPLSDEFVEAWVYDSVRYADLAWVVVGLYNSLDELDLTQRLLASKKIVAHPVGRPPQGERAVGQTDLPALLVVTGSDRPDADDDLKILHDLLEEPWPVHPVSSIDGTGLDELGRGTFEALGIMRVYTKQPGKPADRDAPFTLPVGATVGDLAHVIHKDIEEGLKFARLWGPSAFDGQTVHRDHVLEEGDVVEIHV